jgi:hypothetical protein
VALLARRLLAALAPAGLPSPAARELLAATAGVAFALAPGAVFSANRPEVYALATALGLGALAAATAGDARGALAAALLVGLGAANHPLIAALGAPGTAVAVALRLRGDASVPRARLAAGVAAAGAAGMAVLVYLPARAAALFGPAARAGALDTIAWGDGRTAAGLWWILSARTFVGKNTLVQSQADATALPFMLLEELGPLALLAVYGLFVAVRGRPARPLGLALAATGAGTALAALGAGLDPANPDIRGYLGLTLATVAVLGVAALVPPLALMPPPPAGRRAPVAAWLAAAALAAAAALGLARLPASSLRHAHAADAAAGQIAGELPPRAVLATSHYETAFLVAYGRLVEGRRPDVDWLHLGFARGPGYWERMNAARPELAPLLVAHAQARLRHGALYESPRPIVFEADDHISPALRQHLVPAGPGWGLGGAGPGAFQLSRWSEALFAEAARDRLVRGFLAWRAYQDAVWACAGGPAARAAARQRMQDLRRLVPGDRQAQALGTSCRDAF